MLNKCYTHLAREIGDDWYDLCVAYLGTHPVDNWDLDAVLWTLPEYVELTWLPAHPDRPAWLGELAVYELAEMRAFMGPEAPMEEGASRHRPYLNPTLELLSLEHDIAGWIRACEAGEADWSDGPPARPTLTAVYRDPSTLRCRFLNVNTLTVLAMQSWQDGQTSPELAAVFAPQLGISEAQCLEQLERLADQLADAGAVRWKDAQVGMARKKDA